MPIPRLWAQSSNAISEAISEIAATENPCSGYCDRSRGRSFMTRSLNFEILPRANSSGQHHTSGMTTQRYRESMSSNWEGHGRGHGPGQDHECTGD